MEQITGWSAAWQKFESGASHVAENNLAASTQKRIFASGGAGTYNSFAIVIYRLVNPWKL
jgi:hypothetical protein